MKIIIFILDELYITNNKINHQINSNLPPNISCKILIQYYVKFIKMYIISRKKWFNKNDLKGFEVSILNSYSFVIYHVG